MVSNTSDAARISCSRAGRHERSFGGWVGDDNVPTGVKSLTGSLDDPWIQVPEV